MGDSTLAFRAHSCLGRTCLKWSADGELSEQDLALVMGRLAQVDHQVAVLPQLSLDATAHPT